MTHRTGIQQALDLFDGSTSRLAQAIGQGVVRQNVEHWARAGRVPVKRCPAVSIATGIPVRELNPDFDWDAARRALDEQAA